MAEIIEFPVIDLAATGKKIQQLKEERGLTVLCFLLWILKSGSQFAWRSKKKMLLQIKANGR